MSTQPQPQIKRNPNHPRPWIGVDLDGTLAVYHKFISKDHIGEPIPAMVERVKAWLNEGKYDVKIMTARVCPNRFDFGDTVEECEKIIQDWTEKHIGVRLPCTATKDFMMIQLWDDRCVQVVPNTG